MIRKLRKANVTFFGVSTFINDKQSSNYLQKSKIDPKPIYKQSSRKY